MMNKIKKIIWLTGMPRSGTTWVSQIFSASPYVRVKFCPLFSYSFKNQMSIDDSSDDWLNFFNNVYSTHDQFMDQDHLRNKGLIPLLHTKNTEPELLFIKSNRHHHLTESLLEKIPNLQFIALVRNPLATINSWLTNPTEFPENCDPLEQWRTGNCRKNNDDIGEYWGFDDWIKVTLMHKKLSKQYPERCLLYRYEDLLSEPISSSKKLFNQLDIEFTEEVRSFIQLSRTEHNDNPRSVFKSRINPKRWKSELNPLIITEIQKETKLNNLDEFLED